MQAFIATENIGHRADSVSSGSTVSDESPLNTSQHIGMRKGAHSTKGAHRTRIGSTKKQSGVKAATGVVSPTSRFASGTLHQRVLSSPHCRQSLNRLSSVVSNDTCKDADPSFPPYSVPLGRRYHCAPPALLRSSTGCATHSGLPSGSDDFCHVSDCFAGIPRRSPIKKGPSDIFSPVMPQRHATDHDPRESLGESLLAAASERKDSSCVFVLARSLSGECVPEDDATHSFPPSRRSSNARSTLVRRDIPTSNMVDGDPPAPSTKKDGLVRGRSSTTLSFVDT